MYYLNTMPMNRCLCRFLRIEFICIIWTIDLLKSDMHWFLRIEFICIIWTADNKVSEYSTFLRIEFICIIWTLSFWLRTKWGSWGLNLFVLFEPSCNTQWQVKVLEDWIYLYYLNHSWNLKNLLRVLEDWIYLYYLNSLAVVVLVKPVLEDWIYLYYLNSMYMDMIEDYVLEDWIYLYYLNNYIQTVKCNIVLEDWIYLYYLNILPFTMQTMQFLRIEFICIIWTRHCSIMRLSRSWGLNLFVLFEHYHLMLINLSWVLEDWIYLYYLNSIYRSTKTTMFLRIEFICIIWTFC